MSTFLKYNDLESKKVFNTDDKMMYEHAWEWRKREGERNLGEGDALWRTGLAYITWKDPEIKEGILGCFRKVKGGHHFKKDFYQPMRATGRHGEDDVSRDQVTMAFASLAVNGDTEELHEIASKTPWRLSRRMSMTIDFYFWVKSLTKTKYKKLYANLHLLTQLLFTPIALGLNFIIGKSLGFKSIGNNEYTSRYHYDKRDKWNKFQKSLFKAYYMGYAFHLACWQLYTLPVSNKNPLKWLFCKLMLTHCEQQNFLCRLLLNDLTVTQEDVDNYVPKEGFRWQMRYDGSCPSYHNEKPQEWKDKYLKYNQLDKDCLITMYNKIKNKK